MKFDLQFFTEISHHSEIEPELLMAIAKTESGLNPNTARYEPRWQYHLDVTTWAKKLRISRDTEKVLQSISWGLMQVMGTVARENGFDKHLTQLINPNYNVLIAIRKLEYLDRKYDSIEEIVSAYNQGWPRKDEDGNFVNCRYVSMVMGFYKTLK